MNHMQTFRETLIAQRKSAAADAFQRALSRADLAMSSTKPEFQFTMARHAFRDFEIEMEAVIHHKYMLARGM